MNVEVKDVLTLSDQKEYMVMGMINHRGRDYMYIVDIHDSKNIKFCYQDNDELVVIKDQELISLLLPLLLKSTQDNL